jgi:hypothetical protein
MEIASYGSTDDGMGYAPASECVGHATMPQWLGGDRRQVPLRAPTNLERITQCVEEERRRAIKASWNDVDVGNGALSAFA